MAKGNLKIGHLREFLLLSTELNYSKVAKHFFINQSALSKHILELENVLGVSLFSRSSHAVRLSSAGEQFVPFACEIVEAHDKALSGMEVVRRRMGSAIRIGYVPGASRAFLAEACTLFTEKNPDAYLDIISLDPGEIASALCEDEIDIGIGLSTRYAPCGIFRFTRIYEDRFEALVSKKHPLAEREQLQTTDLKDVPIVVGSSSKMPELGEFLSKQLAGTGLYDQAHELINDRDSITPLLKMKSGAFLVPGHQRGFFGPLYKQIPIVDADLRFDVSLVWKKSCEQSAFFEFESCVRRAYEEYANLT